MRAVGSDLSFTRKKAFIHSIKIIYLFFHPTTDVHVLDHQRVGLRGFRQ